MAVGVSNVVAMVTWQTIAEVNCAAQSAAANTSIARAALLPQNVPTAVAVTRRMRICPRYQRETEILKLSYADACKELRTPEIFLPRI